MADPEIDVFFTGAAVILREHGFGVLADEITTMWSASRATVNGQATRIMELEAEREGLYRKLNPPDAAAPSPAVGREALAALFRAAPGKVRLGDQTPGEIARRLLARYDIRERGETQVEPDGAAQIVAERRRVVTAKGYDAAHDDQHVHGELLDAARCYFNQGLTYFAEFTSAYGIDAYSMYDQNWPWWKVDEPAGWKPSSSPVRNLVKAGQFIAAEIDRLQRAERGDQS